jgi:predicted TIM-barrel fold metal-dependent hydrolase
MNEINDTERLYPHSPDVAERETADGGFSKGWGMHFQPLEETILDVHGHIQFQSFGNADAVMKKQLELMRPLNISRCAVCSPMMVSPADLESADVFSVDRLTKIEELAPYLDLVEKSGILALMIFLHHGNPDRELLRGCIGKGACGMKLHNAPIIVEAADPEIWLHDDWSAVFSDMEQKGLPVLWHVTQRLTDCPYTGGGRNTYWKDGWKKGVTFTNEDLLQIYLKVVEKYPGIPFISAHQLHIGWDRMAGLMDRYPNLFSDTSIGCQVNKGDRMHEGDVRRIREFFIRYSDRMLFGTDSFITDMTEGDSVFDADVKEAGIKNHIRFLRQIRIPYDALQKVFHGNAERLLRQPADLRKM